MLKKLLAFQIFLIVFSFSANAQEKYALLIGINDYNSNEIRDLNYSEPDALYLKEILYKFARFKDHNMTMVLGKDATFLNIKSAIFNLGRKARRDDLVFFYFSGHGTRAIDTDGIELDGFDEAFCPVDTDLKNSATLILDDDFGKWFKEIKAEKIIIVLDCCHSGGAAGRSLQNKGTKGVDMANILISSRLPNFDANLYARDLTVQNKFIITAAGADERSYEHTTLGHGIFTYYLGEAIRGLADSDADGLITTAEMFDYTKSKTLDFVEKRLNEKQTPARFGNLDNVVIAELSDQLVDLIQYDKDLKIVHLGIGRDIVSKGDIFTIKKNLSSTSRDHNITDEDVFKVRITKVENKHSVGEIIEAFHKNIKIETANYKDYYAEKLVYGSISINTTPWSTVYLDGKEIGQTPLTIPRLAKGVHDIEFRIAVRGYPRTVQKIIRVEGKKVTHIVEKFKKE